jgi:hypothetical protein
MSEDLSVAGVVASSFGYTGTGVKEIMTKI